MFAAATAAFFDDDITIDSASGKGSAQAAVCAISNATGIKLSEPKHIPCGLRRIALGVLLTFPYKEQDYTAS